MHKPRALRLLFIEHPSFSYLSTAPVFFYRSDPARSTKYNFDVKITLI